MSQYKTVNWTAPTFDEAILKMCDAIDYIKEIGFITHEFHQYPKTKDGLLNGAVVGRKD